MIRQTTRLPTRIEGTPDCSAIQAARIEVMPTKVPFERSIPPEMSTIDSPTVNMPKIVQEWRKESNTPLERSLSLNRMSMTKKRTIRATRILCAERKLRV